MSSDKEERSDYRMELLWGLLDVCYIFGATHLWSGRLFRLARMKQTKHFPCHRTRVRGLLPPDEPTVNWQHWSGLYKGALRGAVCQQRVGGHAGESVVLRYEAEGDARHPRHSFRASAAAAAVYDADSDKLSRSAGMRYSARTYPRGLQGSLADSGVRGSRLHTSQSWLLV